MSFGATVHACHRNGRASLIEMLDIKERGEDPADLIMDAVERFYLQHE